MSDRSSHSDNKKSTYPCIKYDTKKLIHNCSAIAEMCRAHGIQTAGVIKGFNGHPEIARIIAESGVSFLASSRIEHLKKIKKLSGDTPTMVIRGSMFSEIEDVLDYADYSLQSELEILRALNDGAGNKSLIHHVILMADLGDLREGYWDKKAFVEDAVYIDQCLENIRLAGIGVNLTCFGTIYPTADKMNELIALAEKIEARIGHRLEFISGGSSTSMELVYTGKMPERINLLRPGEAILFGGIQDFYPEELHRDIFTLEAEVIEVKCKPSIPVGEKTVDAFGKEKAFTDYGVQQRIICAVGRVDYGDESYITANDENLIILGASSDHTILIDKTCQYHVGSIVRFSLSYAALAFASKAIPMLPNEP